MKKKMNFTVNKEKVDDCFKKYVDEKGYITFDNFVKACQQQFGENLQIVENEDDMISEVDINLPPID